MSSDHDEKKNSRIEDGEEKWYASQPSKEEHQHNEKRKLRIIQGSLIGVGLLTLFVFLGSPGIFTPPTNGGNNNDNSGASPVEAVVQNNTVTNENNQTAESPIQPIENNTIPVEEQPVVSNENNESGTGDNSNNQSSNNEVVTVPSTPAPATNEPVDNSVTYSGGGSGGGGGGGGHSSGGGGGGSSNHLPVAQDSTIPVLENSENNHLTLSASDADGDSLHYILVQNPQHGSLSWNSSPRTYTPDVGFIGTDSIKFKVNDGKGDSSTATVTITVKSPYDFSPSFAATGSNFDDTPNNESLQLPQFTVAAWFKNSHDYDHQAFIVNKGGFGSDLNDRNLNYGLWFSSGEKLRGGFESPEGANIVEGSKVYRDDQWHYGVLTYDGTEITLYADGQLVNSSPTTSSPEIGNTKPVRIGANSFAANDFFIGNIDEVRIWDRAVSASEVAAQFSSGTFDENGQVLYKSFD